MLLKLLKFYAVLPINKNMFTKAYLNILKTSLLVFTIIGCQIEIEDQNALVGLQVTKFIKPKGNDFTGSSNYTFEWESYTVQSKLGDSPQYKVLVYNDNSCSGTPSKVHSINSNTFTLAGFDNDGQTYSVGIALADQDGLLESVVCSAPIQADKVIPTVTISTTETSPNNSTHYTISGSCSDDKQIKDENAILICAKTSCNNLSDYNQVAACTNGSYETSILSPEGNITFEVLSEDQAGNKSIMQSITGMIIDRTAPSTLNFTSHITSTNINSNTYNFSWIATDAGLAGLSTTQPYTIRFFDNGTCTGTEVSSTNSLTSQYNATGLSNGNSYSIGVVVSDEAGNSSNEFCSQPINIYSLAANLALSDTSNTITANQETFAKANLISTTINNDTGATNWCLSETQSSLPSNSSCSGTGWVSTRPTSFTLSSGEGAKVVYLWLKDSGNVVIPIGTSDTIILDKTAPSVLSFSTPSINTTAQTGVTITGSCETGLDVAFAGTGVLSPSNTTCNAGTFNHSITFSTGEGTKNVQISQTDFASNSSSTSRNFVRDNTNPSLAFLTPAANAEAQTGVTITGSCEAGLTVQLSGAGLSSPASTTCAAGTFSEAITFTAGEGAKAITVSQTDSASNTGSSSRSFVRDNTNPSLTFSTPAANAEAQTGVTITGSCEAGLTVQLSGAGLSSPASTTCAAGNFSEAITFTAGEGAKAISVSQTDSAGNTGSASRSFVRDNTNPSLTFSTPAANAEAQTGVTITGSCEAGLTVQLSGAGLSSPASTTCAAGTFSEAITFTAGEGAKTITVSQTDSAGNTGSGSRSFVRDNTNPTLTFSTPAASTEAQTGVTITGSCEAGLTVQLSGAGLSSPASTTCAAGTFSEAITFTAGDGAKAISVSQTDSAGNTGSGSRSFVRDNTSPILTSTNPADGTEEQSSLTLTGACETGIDIDYAGSGILSAFSASCSGGSYSQTVFFSSGDGSKTITINQTDPAGNSTLVTKSFVRDEAVPNITQTTLTSPHYSSTNSITFGGACEDGYSVSVKLNGTLESTTGCSSNVWSYTVSGQTTDATRTYTFEQTDSAGNTGTATTLWTRDTVDPTLTFTTSSAQATTTDSTTFGGTCETSIGSIVISGEDSSSTTCTGGSWSYAVASKTTDSTYNYTFTLTDQASNATTISGSWTRDTSGPNLTINETNTIIDQNDDTTFTGTCTDGISIDVSGADTATIACSSGTWSHTTTSQITDASRAYQFKQTDALLNETTVSGTWIRDTTAPTITAGFFDLDEGATTIGKTYVSLDLRAVDGLTNVTHFCLKTNDTTAPTLTESCWVAVNGPSPGLIPDPTLDLNDYTYLFSVVPGIYNIYAWVKDEADNISALTNSNNGTTGQDLASITYSNNASPNIDFVIATNTDSPSSPPTTTELTATTGNDVFIKWSISDDDALPATPVSLYFTTDEVNYTLIAANIANNQGAGGCTNDNAGSSLDDGATGCYTWTSPTSNYFRVRLVATDTGSQDAISSTLPLNGGQFRMLAGNTDPGIGGSGDKLSFSPYYETTATHTIAQNSFVVTDSNDVYVVDRFKGILKIEGTTGVASEYLSQTGTYSGDNASVTSATARQIFSIKLDFDNNLWIFDYNLIRKINLTTNIITTVIGGGSDTNDTIADALDLQIRDFGGPNYMNQIFFEILPNGHLYFESEKFHIVNQGHRKIRIYKPEESNQIQTLEFNGTESHFGTHTNGMDNNNFNKPAFEYDPTTSEINYFIGTMFFRPEWPVTSGPEDGYVTSHGDRYYISTFDPATGLARVGGNHFSTVVGSNYHQRHITGRDGRLYILRRESSKLYLADDSDGSLTHIWGNNYGVDCVDGTPILSCDMNIIDVFVSSTGKIYILDDGRIRTADNSGNVYTLYGQNRIYGDGGNPLYARFGKISDTFLGDDGRVVIGDVDNARIREIDTTGQTISHLAGDGSNNPVDTTLVATTQGLRTEWGALGMYMNPATNDIYKREVLLDSTKNIVKFNRSTNMWESVIGGGSLYSWEATADGSVGSTFDIGHLSQTRPVGFANGNLISLTGQYGLVGLENQYYSHQLKLFDTADSYRQSHLLGDDSATHASPWSICSAGTSVTSCLAFLGNEGHATFVHYDSIDDKYITLEKRLSSRVVKILPGTTVEDFQTLPRNADNLTYYRDGSTEWLFYCDNFGDVYKYEVGVGESSIALPSSTIKCSGSTIDYDSTNDRIVFPFEQNGLYGVAEISNP